MKLYIQFLTVQYRCSSVLEINRYTSSSLLRGNQNVVLRSSNETRYYTYRKPIQWGLTSNNTIESTSPHSCVSLEFVIPILITFIKILQIDKYSGHAHLTRWEIIFVEIKTPSFHQMKLIVLCHTNKHYVQHNIVHFTTFEHFIGIYNS